MRGIYGSGSMIPNKAPVSLFGELLSVAVSLLMVNAPKWMWEVEEEERK